MLPEARFTDKEKSELDTTKLAIEMAHCREWIIADEALPDDLLVCYVAPMSTGDELQIACSCVDGAQDRPCAHALGVLNRIRSDEQILIQLFRRKPSSEFRSEKCGSVRTLRPLTRRSTVA